MNTPIGAHIPHAAQPTGTWSGGSTRALFAYPSGSLQPVGSGQVWIGTATIEQSADYSFFAERIRVHVPTKGNGIRLHFGAPTEVVTLPTFAQCRFDGTRPVHAELIDGPVTAFNLIMQPDVEAVVKVLPLKQDTISLSDEAIHSLHIQTADGTTVLHLVYVIAGSVGIMHAEEQAAMLHADEAFVFHPHAMPEAYNNAIMLRRLEQHTEVIVVELHM